MFQIIKTPSVIFCYAKNDSPLKDGAEARIEYDIKCGQGRALSLRYDIESNLELADSSFVFVGLSGGSKPPPYRVGYIFLICAKHPLLFIFQFSLLSFLCRKARPVPTSHKFFNFIAFTQKQTPSCEGVCCVLIFNLILNLNKLKHAFV